MRRSPSQPEKGSKRPFYARSSDRLGEDEGVHRARRPFALADLVECGSARVTRGDRRRADGEESPFWEGDEGRGSFLQEPSGFQERRMAQDVLSGGRAGSHFEIRIEGG